MSHSDPKLLFTIGGIKAYHIQNGTEECLTPSGPQILSLLMVPTSSPFAGLSSTSEVPEEDFYLHLHLPPELDLPLPATTQIYHQPPTSYLIPRWDLGRDSGAFTRIEFPTAGAEKCSQEDIDTFETILAQCTAFLERAPYPKGARQKREKGGKGEKGEEKELQPYNPSDFAPGEAYVAGSSSTKVGGQIVLIDEENGSVVGELGEGFNVIEDSTMHAGSKDPVEITLPQDGSQNIGVAPASQEYLEMAMHPAYKNSSIVSKAAAASRLIVTTSGFIGSTLQNQADGFTVRTKPNSKPMTFNPTTHARIRKIHTFSEGAAGLSAKTVGQVQKYAQNLGANMVRRGDSQKVFKGLGSDGKPVEGYKPGLLNKSMMAFSTVADGIDQAARTLLATTSTATTTVVGHKYGPEAGEISKSITGGFKNVGLVYIDATGVSRRAIVKSVAKGMVVGKVKGKGDLIVGGGDGNVITAPPSNWKEQEAAQGRYTDDFSMAGGLDAPPAQAAVGFGRLTPTSSRTSLGESVEGQKLLSGKR